MLLKILLVDLTPFFAGSLSILSNEEMSWHREVRLDRRITDGRLMIDPPSLVEELLLVLGRDPSRVSWKLP